MRLKLNIQSFSLKFPSKLNSFRISVKIAHTIFSPFSLLYRKHAIIYYSLFILLLQGCKVHYSFSGASVSPDVKTVAIQTFRNNASLAPPTLAQSLTEALKDIFTSQTNLGIVSKNGDLNFEGEIINYLTAPVAIQSGDQAALNRLTITVNVKFTNAKDEKQNFETTFSRYSDYSSSQSLTSVQAQLIDDINKQLAQDIFNKAMINW
ncbi:MAG: LptE family protein [Bacteroidetes bacterium]|nr:LptE family protein [Bacteroidota bacterium]